MAGSGGRHGIVAVPANSDFRPQGTACAFLAVADAGGKNVAKSRSPCYMFRNVVDLEVVSRFQRIIDHGGPEVLMTTSLFSTANPP